NKEKKQSDPAVLQQLRIISAPTDAEVGKAKTTAPFSAAAAPATVGRQVEDPVPPPPPPVARQLAAPFGPIIREEPQLRGQQGQFFVAPPSGGSPSAPGLTANAIARSRDGLYNGAESYNGVTDNPFLTVVQNPLSTFSIDVDTASYSN